MLIKVLKGQVLYPLTVGTEASTLRLIRIGVEKSQKVSKRQENSNASQPLG